tara:strand:+ start:38 stop:787 length:750 start_codon:yes stop_codon:yes gene_type:complete
MFPLVLIGITGMLFIFEPMYQRTDLHLLPHFIENYFSKANGSVFTIFPWFGYATMGAFLSILFTRFKSYRYLYPVAIGIAMLLGTSLIFYSSDFFLSLSKLTGVQLFADIFFNNYLFIRLGDVFLAFAFFMLIRSLLQNETLLKIGQSTLSIYVIHFMILYGSLTGIGLYRFFDHSLSPAIAIIGAVLFMAACSYAALRYEKRKAYIKENLALVTKIALSRTEHFLVDAAEIIKSSYSRLLRLLGFVKG